MTDLGSWAQQGECRKPDVSQEWFFPERENSVVIPRAKAVCDRCPVKRPCLEEAVLDRSLEGIWGGTTDNERQRIRAFLGARSLGEAIGE